MRYITHNLRGVDPFPVWVLRARELGSGPPVRVVHVDRESRVFVAIHAERACLEHFGEDLLEWSSPAHMRHENWLREAHPQRWCLRKQSAAIVGPAFAYVRVRALEAPFALLCKVSTAACLASKDAITPLLALLAGGLTNLGLDILLVCGLGHAVH